MFIERFILSSIAYKNNTCECLPLTKGFINIKSFNPHDNSYKYMLLSPLKNIYTNTDIQTVDVTY